MVPFLHFPLLCSLLPPAVRAKAELAFLSLNRLIFCKVNVNDVTLELLDYGKTTYYFGYVT